MTGRGALALRRARRHLGRVPRRVEREARERSTGGVVRSGAQVLLRDRDTRPLVVISSARRDRSSHGPRRASIHHVVRRAPALELRTQGARAPAGVPGDGERHGGRGVRGRQRGLKGAPPPSPTPPLAHAAPLIVGKEKNARPSGRHTAWSLPSDDPSHLKRTKRSSFSVLRSPFSAPRSSTRRSREATWAPRDRSPRTSTSSRSGRTPTPRGTGCGSTSAFQTRGPARRFFST